MLANRPCSDAVLQLHVKCAVVILECFGYWLNFVSIWISVWIKSMLYKTKD